MGLESRSGLVKYLHAREYRKASKETLHFVKQVSDRGGPQVKHAAFGYSSPVPMSSHDTVRARGMLQRMLQRISFR
jgi:hypothetical protein